MKKEAGQSVSRSLREGGRRSGGKCWCFRHKSKFVYISCAKQDAERLIV